MKRWISLVISIVMQMGAIAGMTAWAEEAQPLAVTSVQDMQIGEYFILGKYNEEPIVWRYMDEDENGKLMVSDRILCEKPFGDTGDTVADLEKKYGNYWKGSYARTWLNSDVNEGEVDWSVYVSKREKDDLDCQEEGFLHESNFSVLEKKVMKPVTQWTMLPEDRLNLSENGLTTAYTAIKKTIPGNPRDGGGDIDYTIPELPEVYTGAAHQTTDTMFLLDEIQIYHMWENFGDVKAQARISYQPENSWVNPWINRNGYDCYYLRTPSRTKHTLIGATERDGYLAMRSSTAGIRPAFYLDEDEAMILSGNGTAEDPYVMSGKEIRVTVNEKEMQLDQPAMIKDGIVLVPLRSIFEALGADIHWDEANQTVTATKGEEEIKVQIGSSILNKNGTEIDLGYPALLEGERTMVPLNAIEEGLGVTAAWNGDTLQVTIIG